MAFNLRITTDSMLKGSPLKLNFGVLLLAQFYGQALAAVSGVILVRWLGPSEYGRYTLAVTGLNVGLVVADAGLSAFLGREAARLDQQGGLALWLVAIKTRLKLSLILGFVTVALAVLWPPLGQPSLIALADLSLLPMSIMILTTAFLNGQGRTPLSAGLNAVIGTLNLALLLPALWWQAWAWSALVINLLVSVAGALLLVRPLLRASLGHIQNQIAWSELALLKASRSFLLIGLASLFFQYADIYLVSLFLGEEAVGQYGAALRFLALMTTIPTVWGVVAVPRFASIPHNTRRELVAWNMGLVVSGLGLAVGGAFLAKPLVIWLLGSKYGTTGLVLSWIVWAGAGIFASAAPVTWLTVTNRQHLIVVALVGADVLGLILTILAGGILKWGLEGIALARVSTSWILCALYIWLGWTHSKAVVYA